MDRRVYRAVEERAGSFCECCGQPFGSGMKDRPTLDHFQGRARSETVQSCWMLRADHHAEKSANSPSAAYWFARYGVHCRRHGYLEELGQALEELSWRTAKRTTA